MLNPWILAGLVLGAIGLIQEAADKKEQEKKAEKKAAKAATGKPATAPVSVVVNSQGTREGKTAKAKPSAGVPKQPTDTTGQE